MTLKPKIAAIIEPLSNNLPGSKNGSVPEKRHQKHPEFRNGHDHWKEIQKAISEKDIMELRKLLQNVAANYPPGHKGSDDIFDLTDKTSLRDFSDILSGDPPEMDTFSEPLPKIHVHHHRREKDETVHLFYRDQKKSENEENDVFGIDKSDDQCPGMEDALKERDIMELRKMLEQIEKSVSSHRYKPEEIEGYIDGILSPEEQAFFEDELTATPELKADIDLYTGFGEAVAEKDIISLRESLGRIMRTENSTSRNLEEIEAYLEGELDGDGYDTFVDELSENRGLRSEVLLVKELDNALSEDDIFKLRDKLQQISHEIYTRENKSLLPVSGTRKNRGRLGIVAAVFIFLLGITSLYRFSESSGLTIYDKFYTSHQAPATFRSVHSEADRNLLDGLKYFNQSDYSNALLFFRKVRESDPNNPAACFYSGASYQCMNKLGMAIPEYDLVIRHNNSLFVEQAEWYRALCFVGTGEKTRAVGQLEAIIKRNGYYRKDAFSLISQLKK